jgi:hypothetical protein
MSFILMGAQGSAGHQPGIPTIGTATTSASQTVSVPFTAPSYLGKPTGTSYIATSNPGAITGTSSTSPISVTGLTNGTSYTFTVKLNNGVVDSLSSEASNSVTPVVPGPFFPPFFPYFPFFPTFLPCTPGTVCATGTNNEPQGPCDYVIAWSSTCTCTVEVSYVCY